MSRSLARRTLAIGVGLLGLVLSSAGIAEETSEVSNPATSASDTQSPDTAPFVGNIELKSRLDAPGKLAIAGERLHGALLRRFYVAHDCGQIINPDGLRNQIEGCIVQTMSRALKEQVTFDRAMVTSLDWASYPILTFPEIPEVMVDLIDRPQEVPWGGGEPTCAVVPSAIAGAVFEATGARLRSVPFTPDKLLAALKAL